MKGVYKWTLSVFVFHYRRLNEGFEAIMSISSCWKLVPYAVSHLCHVPESENLSRDQAGTIVYRPCIRSLNTREPFCCINGGDIQIYQERCGLGNYKALIMDNVHGMNVTVPIQYRREKCWKLRECCPIFGIHQFIILGGTERRTKIFNKRLYSLLSLNKCISSILDYRDFFKCLYRLFGPRGLCSRERGSLMLNGHTQKT